ncbi:hypothetical protein, partial [Sinorhizobium americanum]|uniref:hypothetical protein n=1 Tax=Sinorhizobium americanum TaxID=194963 RepID=UPI001A9DEF07
KISLSQPGNSRAKVVVASSAAALVSDRAYRPAPFPQSTTIFKNSADFCKLLIFRAKFYTSE